MHETTKAPGQPAGDRDADAAAVTGNAQGKQRLDRASLGTALDALLDRIGQDARDDAVAYLLRSDTAHNGE